MTSLIQINVKQEQDPHVRLFQQKAPTLKTPITQKPKQNNQKSSQSIHPPKPSRALKNQQEASKSQEKVNGKVPFVPFQPKTPEITSQTIIKLQKVLEEHKAELAQCNLNTTDDKRKQKMRVLTRKISSVTKSIEQLQLRVQNDGSSTEKVQNKKLKKSQQLELDQQFLKQQQQLIMMMMQGQLPQNNSNTFNNNDQQMEFGLIDQQQPVYNEPSFENQQKQNTPQFEQMIQSVQTPQFQSAASPNAFTYASSETVTKTNNRRAVLTFKPENNVEPVDQSKQKLQELVQKLLQLENDQKQSFQLMKGLKTVMDTCEGQINACQSKISQVLVEAVQLGFNIK